MSTFIMEYEITVGNQEKIFLEKCFNIGSNINNLCLNRCLKQLNKLKRDKEYLKSVKAIKNLNKRIEKKNISQIETIRIPGKFSSSRINNGTP